MASRPSFPDRYRSAVGLLLLASTCAELSMEGTQEAVLRDLSAEFRAIVSDCTTRQRYEADRGNCTRSCEIYNACLGKVKRLCARFPANLNGPGTNCTDVANQQPAQCSDSWCTDEHPISEAQP